MLGDSVRRRLPAPRPWRRSRQERQTGDGGGVRWRFWIPALASALGLPFAIGYIVAVFVLFPPQEVRGAGIEVPRLVGLELDRAQADARATGLGELEVTRLPHPTRPPGIVTAQSPLEGQELRAGTTVGVAVSAGRPRVAMPDVIGFSADRAEGLLTRLGFGVVRIEEESTVEQGRVTRVDPAPGAVRELPSTVSLMVSTGPPPDTLFGIDTLLPGPSSDTLLPGLPSDTLLPRVPSDTPRPGVRIDTLGARDTMRRGDRLQRRNPAHGRGEYLGAGARGLRQQRSMYEYRPSHRLLMTNDERANRGSIQ